MPWMVRSFRLMVLFVYSWIWSRTGRFLSKPRACAMDTAYPAETVKNLLKSKRIEIEAFPWTYGVAALYGRVRC
jgi:hypothetical protein